MRWPTWTAGAALVALLMRSALGDSVRDEARAAFAAGEFARADSLLREATDREGRALWVRAELELGRGANESVLATARSLAWEAARANDAPALAAALVDLGRVELDAVAPDSALVHFRAARELVLHGEGADGETPRTVAAADLVARIAATESALSNPAAAESLLTVAIPVLEREAPEGAELPRALAALGYAHSLISRFGEAESEYRRSLALREARYGPAHLEVARSLVALGGVLRQSARFGEAWALFDRTLALPEAKVPANHPLRANVHAQMAGILWELGAYDDAARHMERAIEIQRVNLGEEHPAVILSHLQLGTLLEQAGHAAAALPEYEFALRAYEHRFGPNHPNVGSTLYRMADVLRALGRDREAWQLSTRALAIGEATFWGEHPEYAEVLQGHAALQAARGDCVAAAATLARADALYRRVFGIDHPHTAASTATRAAILPLAGEPDSALVLALDVEARGREQLRVVARSLPESEALEYADERANGLDLALSLLEQGVSDQVEAVWDAAIRSRLVVLDETTHLLHALATREGAALPERTRRDRAMEKLAERLLRLEDASEEAGIDSARWEFEAAERALLAVSGEDRATSERARIGFDAVARALPPGAALVRYLRFQSIDVSHCPPSAPRDVYGALMLTNDAPRFYVIGEAAMVDSLVEAWRRDIAGTTHGDGSRAAEALGAAIAAPLLDAIEGVAGSDAHPDVYVVPDGALHLINFAALPTAPQQQLIDRGAVLRMLAAERDLVRDETRAPRGDDASLLVMGDPDFDAALAGDAGAPRAMRRGDAGRCLEFGALHWSPLAAARLEVDETVDAWSRSHRERSMRGLGFPVPRPSRRLTGRDATEAALRREAPRCTELHLATHGFFLDPRCVNDAGALPDSRGVGGYVEVAGDSLPLSPIGPASPLLLAGLAFAGANRNASNPENDGILTAEEIAALDLHRVESVVLSACDTGVGRVQVNEGVLGLRRAFAAAGVDDVIMSLWPVGDAAAREWMRAYYHARWIEHLDCAGAAWRATGEVRAARRARGESDAPFYWAPFIAVAAAP
ncbi:MAG: CHAT domain-containing tetratricopeptide repeat protein [Candidatus Eisenbacteria bacterium]